MKTTTTKADHDVGFCIWFEKQKWPTFSTTFLREQCSQNKVQVEFA